jgi:hypothetical protein
LFGTFAKTIQTDIASENFIEKTTLLKDISPKNQLSLSKNTSWDFFYELQNKENQIGNFESLVQNRFGTPFHYEKQITLNGEVSFIRINLMGMNFLLLVFKCSNSNRAEYNLEITLKK